MIRLALATTTLLLALGIGVSGASIHNASPGRPERSEVSLASNTCRSVYDTSLKATGIPFGNSISTKTSLPHHPELVVRSTCRLGRGGGWTISARESGHSSSEFQSETIAYSSPVAILALYNYSSQALPAIVAQVGLEMTGRPYELLTFNRQRIVPVKMTFPTYGLTSLTGGGAAAHGQGVECSRQRNRFQLTQLFWSVLGASAPAPGDKVSVQYVRWTFQGQPLVQVTVGKLPSKVATYSRASSLNNEHCSG
jgi:hypothetical protein